MSMASLIQWCLLRSYRMSLAFFQFLIWLILGFPPLLFLFWLVCIETSPSHILFGVLNDCPVSPLYVVLHDRQGIAYMTRFLVLVDFVLTTNCCCFVRGCTRVLMWYVFMVLWTCCLLIVVGMFLSSLPPLSTTSQLNYLVKDLLRTLSESSIISEHLASECFFHHY